MIVIEYTESNFVSSLCSTEEVSGLDGNGQVMEDGTGADDAIIFFLS